MCISDSVSATNEMICCVTTDQREDGIWGVLSLLIVFLPGAIMGIGAMLGQIFDIDWCCAIFYLILGIPLPSVGFPLIVLLIPLFSIFQKCRKEEVDQEFQTIITQAIGLESSIESTSQLLLNGYHSTSPQKITIVA